MEAPPFWAHTGALHMAKKYLGLLGWEKDSQSAKKLEGKVIKSSDIGLELTCGGRAPIDCNVYAAPRIVLASKRKAKSGATSGSSGVRG